jgi:hypothetical protein
VEAEISGHDFPPLMVPLGKNTVAGCDRGNLSGTPSYGGHFVAAILPCELPI